MSVLETNVSRHRHTAAIHVGHRGKTFGYIYSCPRCPFVARPMRWRAGAMRHGDEHALVCGRKGAAFGE